MKAKKKKILYLRKESPFSTHIQNHFEQTLLVEFHLNSQLLIILQQLKNKKDIVIPDIILLHLNDYPKIWEEFAKQIKSDHTLNIIPIIGIIEDKLDPINRAYDLFINCVLPMPSNEKEVESFVHKIRDFWLLTALLPNHNNENG